MLATSTRIGRTLGAQFHRVVGLRFYKASNAGGASDDQYVVDLRSDTLTKPTKPMLDAMVNSTTFGDDVFNEESTVHKLQDHVAKLFGKEAALFVPTGTMGNLLCVMAHCYYDRSLEVLVGDKSHLCLYEQGGISVLGGIHSRQLANLPDGTFDLDLFDSYIRPLTDPHQPFTALIAVENPHTNCGGKVLPLSYLEKVRQKATEHNIKVHMDGARVMNAAVALGVPVTEILQHVDSVNMCFSKGLGAPIGSIIAGDKELIARALRLRKMLGGGWRQAGPLASAALYALEQAPVTLARDHANAKRMAKALKEHGQGVVDVDIEGVHTNILMINIIKPGLTAQHVCDRLNTVSEQEEEKTIIKSMVFYKYVTRFVTCCNLTEEDVQRAERKIATVLHDLKQS